MSTDLVYPEEGELVVVSVKSVKQNGADVTLDEYEGVDGFIFIGEIALSYTHLRANENSLHLV